MKLADKTRVDSHVGLPTFAINLIARPTPLVQQKFSAIQDAIALATSEGVLYRCPASSLHLSVFHFVWARRVEKSADESAWSDHQIYIIERLNAVASSTDAFMLGHPSIVASESAVILRFYPSAALEALRDDISSIAGLNFVRTKRPTIQHVSIFRYQQEVSLHAIQEACRNIQIADPGWTIEELRLVRENVYPSLDLDLIHALTLRRGSPCQPTARC